MAIYYIVLEYDSPKAVFETKRQAKDFIDGRPNREIEMVVSGKTVSRAMRLSKQNS